MFFGVTVAGYFIATVIYLIYLVTHRVGLVKTGKYVLLAGFAAHSITLVSRWVEAGRTPVTNLHESLIVFAWLTVLVYLTFVFRYRVSALGAFVAPFALALVAAAWFMPDDITPLAPLLDSYWLPVHVVLAFLGNAFFALACIFGLMYLIQDHYLKSHRIKGLYFVLPSVELLDELNYRCLSYGFPLLTLAIITGAMWSEHAMGSYWDWGARQIWSLITWLLYAALLHGRLTTGWRGRKSAMLSVAAFVVLIGSFVTLYALLGGGHGLLK